MNNSINNIIYNNIMNNIIGGLIVFIFTEKLIFKFLLSILHSTQSFLFYRAQKIVYMIVGFLLK